VRLNPEESLEWLREYKPDTQHWVGSVYEWMEQQADHEREKTAILLEWAKEKGILDRPEFTEGKWLVWPVKTGRNRP